MTEPVPLEPNLFNEKEKKDRPPKKTRKRLWIFLLLVVGALLGYFAVSHLFLENVLPVDGKVKAFKEVKIKTLSEGVLKEVHGLNAQSLQKGDALFVFQNDEITGKLFQALHEKENLDEELKRFEKVMDHSRRQSLAAKELHEKGVIGKLASEEKELTYLKNQNLFAQKKRELEAVSLDIQAFQRQKDSLLMMAPFDGIFLGDLSRRVNTYFKQGERLGIFYDPSRFYVEALVPETEARQLEMGQEARVVFKAFPGSFSGKIIQIDQKTEEVIEKVFKVKHIVKIKIILDDFPQGLRPGMRADAKIFLTGAGKGDLR